LLTSLLLAIHFRRTPAAAEISALYSRVVAISMVGRAAVGALETWFLGNGRFPSHVLAVLISKYHRSSVGCRLPCSAISMYTLGREI
jgi:hypothetical protein